MCLKELTSHVLFSVSPELVELEVVQNQISFGLVEQLGSLRVGRHDEAEDQADEDGNDTLDEEEPSPACDALLTIELKDADGDQTTNGVTELGAGVKDGGSDGQL